jgi:hypothetical protein
VAWGAGVYPTSFTTFATGAAPVTGGSLGALDITGFTPGTYTLRVTGFENDDSLSEYVRVDIDPSLHAGWPQTVDVFGGVAFTLGWAQAPSIADLDGDGKGDVLVLTNTNVYAFRRDGAALPGWPQANGLGSTNGQTQSVAAADIDNDGHTDVVVTDSGSVAVFASDGTLRWRRQVPVGSPWNMQPVLSDLDGDGKKEIILKTWDNGIPSGSMMVWSADGSTFGQWPYVFSAQHSQQLGFQSFGAQDVDGDGHKEVITLMNDSVSGRPVLFVWSFDGTLRPGYPKEIPLDLSIFDHPMMGPVIADIDGDGLFEVGFAQNNGGCNSTIGSFVWAHLDGSLLPGWPASFFDQVNGEQASAADLDHDGKVETVIATVGAGCDVDHRFAVNVLRSDGTPLPGWPQRTVGQAWAQAAIADLDGDGKSEVIVGDSRGLVYAWNIAGALLAGFPKKLGTPAMSEIGVKSCPAVGDLDGTGKVALVAGTTGGAMFAWDLGTPFNPLPTEWRMYQADASHAGLAFTAGAPPPVTTTLSSVADAYVRDGTNAGTNFGADPTLPVKNGNAGNNRMSYLRFPLTGVGAKVNSAKLRLYGSRSAASTVTDSAFAVASNSWTETGINWNNRPALGARQGTGVVVATTAGYQEWDVTAFVQSQRTAGVAEVSLAVSMDTLNNTPPPDLFNAREAASNRPQLVVVATAVTNAAPTVVTPAGASPSPVTGTTAALSVLGGDDQGEASLIYTWSTTGTPPAAVTFSANGTNGAKSTTATFTAAGTYAFLVTLQDGGGLTATSPVTVTVNQTLTSIAVTPATATVAPSASRQFAASARDQFGVTLTPQPSFAWTVSGGGTIDGTGLFVAGASGGGPFTVTAASGGRSGTASVTVSSGGGTFTLAPTADAYVRDGTNANTNFGTDATLQTKNTTSAGNNRRSYLKFDITSVSGTIVSAKLRLYGNHTTAGSTSDSAFAVSSNSWTEAGITWNNQPARGAKQGSTVTVTTTAKYYEWDVTAFVKTQRSAAINIVSLAVTKDDVSDNSPDTFNSRQATSNRPQLVVTSN